MDGQVGVRSEPGKGSTFWFEAPFGISAQAAAPQTTVANGDALMVEVNPQGEIWIQGAAVDDAAVQQQLKDLGQHNPQAEVQLRADTSVPYGRVVEVMGAAHQAGLQRIGFVAEPAKAGAP